MYYLFLFAQSEVLLKLLFLYPDEGEIGVYRVFEPTELLDECDELLIIVHRHPLLQIR